MESPQCNTTFQQYFIPVAFVALVFFIILFLIIIKNICCRKRKWPPGFVASDVEKWERIEELSKKDDTRPLSIIYACSLLDDILIRKGYFGESLNERLDSAHTAIGNSRIKKIVRLRNELAHNSDMKDLNKKQTEQDLKIVRQVLFDLDVSV